MSEKLLREALQAACNYIDTLGGVSTGYRAALSQPAPSPQPADSDDQDAKWRDVALRFDKHRMSALWHLQAMLKDPARHAEVVRKFLSDPTHPDVQPAVPVVHVGNLPTMNQDEYPPLGEWWVQLWDGTGDDAKVIARVYGGDPHKAKEKAESIARAIRALRPQAVPMTDEVRRSYQCLLAMNTPHGFGDRIGPFVRWLQDSGITAKAEGGV